MNKKIAVLITHDFEDTEYHHPVEAFVPQVILFEI